MKNNCMNCTIEPDHHCLDEALANHEFIYGLLADYRQKLLEEDYADDDCWAENETVLEFMKEHGYGNFGKK